MGTVLAAHNATTAADEDRLAPAATLLWEPVRPGRHSEGSGLKN